MPFVAPLSVPPVLQQRVGLTHQEWLEAGVFAVALLCHAMKREDLSGVDLLDVGCGTKLAETLLGNSMAIGSYVGIDVSADLIDWLQANVSDPRFEFHRLDAHNERYNPDGDDLGSFELLPVGERYFDLICLFSVFTHLAPHDYVSMLRLLRRHAKSDARLLFSLFLIDEEGECAVQAGARGAAREPRSRGQAAGGGGAGTRPCASRLPQRIAFHRRGPDQPLRVARYEPDYALELIAGTGWDVLEVHPPEDLLLQHYMICAPV